MTIELDIHTTTVAIFSGSYCRIRQAAVQSLFTYSNRNKCRDEVRPRQVPCILHYRIVYLTLTSITFLWDAPRQVPCEHAVYARTTVRNVCLTFDNLRVLPPPLALVVEEILILEFLRK
jgi:hypothetical protein